MTEKDKVTVDDIIGIVKTEEQTNSVALKKEAQLSICEKRLIELEKENEQLKSEIEKLSYANEDLLSEKRNWQRMSDEYCKLLEENEQLKKESYGNLDGLNYYQEQNGYLSSKISDLECENEQLKEQLSEAKTDKKQLGISFMGYKMKLIEVLQKKYDKVKGKTLYADVYTEIAEEMGVDLE